ncbi:hypothetical protein Tco_0441232 [Tanacetum coccineum]
MVQKPRSRRTRFGGDGVAVKFGGGGCGGWWRDSGICVMVERWRRGDEGGVEMVVWPRWRRVAWWQHGSVERKVVVGCVMMGVDE